LITLILTVLNEGQSISRLMESLVSQTRLPDEIVVVDGGSKDNTVDVIESYASDLPLRVIVEPGCNISRGRNRALEEANGGIIAVVDAGVRIENDWLERITQPFIDDHDVSVVGGFFQADPFTLFEVAMGATVLPLADEIDPATFLPSSRSVALRKSAADSVGGYPEWLDYCEDLVFDLRLKQVAGTFAFAPDALVYFRPRSSLRAFFKQYYLYARGDGKADLWRKRHVIRYITYLLFAPLILILGFTTSYLFYLLFFIGAVAYLYRPYKRLPVVLKRAPEHSFAGLVYVVMLVPVIRLLGDVAKMVGYPVGWLWRLRNRPPDWKFTKI
jgi:glycosyltransferase involved in cell wall biosynthesis